jgi:ubiquinone/menaquinone biosynthesis C-methylase UbiE
MGTDPMVDALPLFDRIKWQDPVTGVPMDPMIMARNPAGVPIWGALKLRSTDYAYPIVDSVARVTPELARRYEQWLNPLGLKPAERGVDSGIFQEEATVDSFGFQWDWNSSMRSEADLIWRVASRFHLEPTDFEEKLVLDAGAGAGDQSRWLLEHGAEVASVDLSSAIDVVARKLRLSPNWVGIQGDITALPLTGKQFDVVYCEGVIQHTRDSAETVKQLIRMLNAGGLILATHYHRPSRRLALIKHAYLTALRKRLSRLDRYKLLLVTGNLAALSYVPVIGRLVRLSGTAMYYDLMPDFETTWTNTFDRHGNHAYQRHVTPGEFWDYFEQAGDVEAVLREGTVVIARRGIGTVPDPKTDP